MYSSVMSICLQISYLSLFPLCSLNISWISPYLNLETKFQFLDLLKSELVNMKKDIHLHAHTHTHGYTPMPTYKHLCVYIHIHTQTPARLCSRLIN